MKKIFLLPACVMIAVAISFGIFTLNHPELSPAWNTKSVHIFYGLYVDMVVLLVVLAFWEKTDKAYFSVVILELGAIFFLVQSIFTVIPEGESNWYLPMALGLNCVALYLNAVQRRKNKKKV